MFRDVFTTTVDRVLAVMLAAASVAALIMGYIAMTHTMHRADETLTDSSGVAVIVAEEPARDFQQTKS